MDQQLPPALLESLRKLPGFSEKDFLQAHHQPPITSIRINQQKANRFNIRNTKDIIPAAFEPVPWSKSGYYLMERPSFTLDPLFHAGAYYVQEASSMFLEQAMRQTLDLTKDIKVLDLCGAPGGKSTLIQSLITSGSLLVTNEVIKSRVNILAENIQKWGSLNTIISHNDPADFNQLENFFDLIVIDAPCSGSGLFRKEPDAINEWSPQNVALCSQRQQRILMDALPALKKDGLLIYSTCSYSPAEDEEILDWLADQETFESISIPVEDHWHIMETKSPKHNLAAYRFFPGNAKGEGFFIACFRKTKGGDFINTKKKRNRFTKPANKEISILQEWLEDAELLDYIKPNDNVYALPAEFIEPLSVLSEKLRIIQSGVCLGKLAKNQLIPHHALSLSVALSDHIPRLALSKEDALNYLRKENLSVDQYPEGWMLPAYKDYPLGWAKGLHKRINNYYPSSLRVRMQ